MSNILPVILMAIPSYLIVVSIHELGHFITGLSHRFKCFLFVNVPFGFKRDKQDKVAFYLEKNPALWGGIVGVLPKVEDSGNFKAFARVLIGGPLFAWVFGAISLYLYFQVDHQFLLLLGAMAVAMSITTLILSRLGAFYSNGGRFLRIVRNTKARDVELALFNIIQRAIIHQGYAHINITDTQPLIDYEDHREQYFYHFYAMNYYKERGCKAMEEKHQLELKNLESKVPKSFVKLMAR